MPTINLDAQSVVASRVSATAGEQLEQPHVVCQSERVVRASTAG